MNSFLFVILPLLISTIPAFGESHPEYSGIEDPSKFHLKVNDDEFFIPFHVDANVIAMQIDPELTSLLIGLENTSDSVFEIDLKHELISAHDNEFAILVNGLEIDYDVVSDSDSTTFTFFVPEFTEEVEIIGTHVIPEFTLGATMGFAVLVLSVVAISGAKLSIFRL